MAKKRSREFRLKVGEYVIGMICRLKKHIEYFETYFGINNSDEEADIQLRTKFISHKKILDIPDSMFNAKVIEDDKFIMGDNLVSGQINPETGLGTVRIKIGLFKGTAVRVLEQVLYQAFYNAVKLNNADSFLIHSSGVIYKNKGYLFVGPSESGKSTIADLSSDYHILNDEICHIGYRDSQVIISSTPFNGLYRKKYAGSAVLESIFILEQAKHHKIRDVKKSIAVKLLAKEIVPPVGLNELIDQKTFVSMIDMADRLYRSVPIKKLEFLPDNQFWHEIDNEFLGGEK
ncbi:MAG: hypothetical protein SVR08_07370 [Spirochaetota bacterium]|nr:hypothetical protein [Spirochaetota bacterium]